jgi:hypothetical protein
MRRTKECNKQYNKQPPPPAAGLCTPPPSLNTARHKQQRRQSPGKWDGDYGQISEGLPTYQQMVGLPESAAHGEILAPESPSHRPSNRLVQGVEEQGGEAVDRALEALEATKAMLQSKALSVEVSTSTCSIASRPHWLSSGSVVSSLALNGVFDS